MGKKATTAASCMILAVLIALLAVVFVKPPTAPQVATGSVPVVSRSEHKPLRHQIQQRLGMAANVTLTLRDAATERPAPHAQISIAGIEAVSDGYGVVQMRVPWGLWDVVPEAPWEVAHPSQMVLWLWGEDHIDVVTLIEDCPGVITVLEDGKGAPHLPVRMISSPFVGATDAKGQFEPSPRPCGLAEMFVGDPPLAQLTAHITQPGPITVALPPVGEAELWVVDEHERLVDANIKSHVVDPGFTVTHSEPGVYHLSGMAHTAKLWVNQQSVRVPLDGEVHVHQLSSADWFLVQVDALCDDACPPLSCGETPCTKMDDDSYECTCPAPFAPLYPPESRAIARLTPEDARVTVDLRGTPGQVCGLWDGDFPVLIAVGHARPTSTQMTPSFCVEAKPGLPRLLLQGPSMRKELRVEVRSQETTDVGTITPPDTHPIDVWVNGPVDRLVATNHQGHYLDGSMVEPDTATSLELPVDLEEVILHITTPTSQYRHHVTVTDPIEVDLSSIEHLGLSDRFLDAPGWHPAESR